MKDRTAIICTVLLAATMVGCTVYVAHAIRDAADEIAGDDDSDASPQKTARDAGLSSEHIRDTIAATERGL